MRHPRMLKTRKLRTICEVLRECYELTRDEQVREKLVEAQHMAKRMSRKLLQYNQKAFKGWWEKNPDYAEDIKRKERETRIK